MIKKLSRVMLFCVTLLLYSGSIRSQNKIGNNLIIDSSFEKNNYLGNGNYVNPDTFNKRSKYWISPTNNTPDLLSYDYKEILSPKLPKIYYPLRDNQFNLKSPDTLSIYPKTGRSLADIVIYNNISPSNKFRYSYEFIQTHLNQKLKQNTKYKLLFNYIKKSSFLIRDSTPPIDFLFSNIQIKNRDDFNCYLKTDCTNFKEKYNPQLRFYNLPFSYSSEPKWQQQSAIFKNIDSTLEYLTIGHFSDSTYLDNYFSRKFIQDICYYLDDISINEIPCIVAPDTVCFGSKITLSTTLRMPYYWSSKLDGSDTLSKDSSYIYFANKTETLYAFGQLGKDSAKIIVNKILRPNWSDTSHFCADSFMQLESYNPKSQYRWNTGSIESKISINQTGLYTLFIHDNYGCKDSFSTYAIKHELPIIKTENNYTLCQEINDIVMLDPGYHFSCSWQPINSNNCIQFVNYNINLNLTVKNEYGCTNYQEIIISDNCTPLVFIPNAIHLDGINKTFSPQIKYAKNIDLKIFNRWGEILFEQNDTKVEWDGKYDESFCMPGLYFYIINITPFGNQETLVKKGSIRVF